MAWDIASDGELIAVLPCQQLFVLFPPEVITAAEAQLKELGIELDDGDGDEEDNNKED